MFKYRDGKPYCVIHSGTEMTWTTTKVKKKTKAFRTCEKCDALIESWSKSEGNSMRE